MSLADYTTHDEIRALLGVSDEELENETIDLPVYLTGLYEDLYEVNSQAQSLFENLPPEADQTPKQARVSRLTKSFAAFSVAKQLATSMPMFAPRSVADGKASMARFLDPYKQTIKALETNFDRASDKLQEAIDDLLSESRAVTRPPWMLSVGLARDPVTQGD